MQSHFFGTLGRASLVALFCLTTLTLGPERAFAAMPKERGAQVLIVENDPGGLLLERLAQLRLLVAQDTQVEIRGDICHSSCTMLLSLPDVCVLPETVFGFHGPSYAGRPLEPIKFERVSRLIAQFYPDNLRHWYLTKARHHIDGYKEKTGSELIAMGFKRCDTKSAAVLF